MSYPNHLLVGAGSVLFPESAFDSLQHFSPRLADSCFRCGSRKSRGVRDECKNCHSIKKLRVYLPMSRAIAAVNSHRNISPAFELVLESTQAEFISAIHAGCDAVNVRPENYGWHGDWEMKRIVGPSQFPLYRIEEANRLSNLVVVSLIGKDRQARKRLAGDDQLEFWGASI